MNISLNATHNVMSYRLKVKLQFRIVTFVGFTASTSGFVTCGKMRINAASMFLLLRSTCKVSILYSVRVTGLIGVNLTVNYLKFRTLVALQNARQTAKTQIRLLLKKQSDQCLLCLLFWRTFREFQP